MGTQRVQIKGVLPWLVHWAFHAGTRDFCPALAALGPGTKYFFLIVHYFHLFVAIAQQAVQAVVPDRLSLNMCLWSATLYCPEIRLIFVLLLPSLPFKINQ